MANEIKIETYQNILTSLVVSVASQVEGIASVTYDPGLMVPSHKKRKQSAVDIAIIDNLVTINIHVNVFYGYVIPLVVCNLQEKIKAEVEAATSLKVKKINVTVVGSVAQ